MMESGRPTSVEVGAGVISQCSVLSSHYGQNIKLSANYKSAWRAKGYNSALVFSSLPLPNSCLFQFEILETVDWSGSLKVGVTSLPPERTSSAETACQLRDHSYVVASCGGVSCLYVGGTELMSMPQITDIASLGVGSIIGVLVTSRTSLHFFFDQAHLCIELPAPLKLPRQRYVVIDIYGKCSKIKLHPTTHVDVSELSKPSHTLKLPYELVSKSLRVTSKKKSTNKKETPKVSLEDSSLLPSPSKDICSSKTVQVAPPIAVLSSDSPLESVVSDCQPRLKHCDYQALCERFLKSLNIPESYFDRMYDKCYCGSCVALRREPSVKYHGQPLTKCSVPLGWMKFGLRLKLFFPQSQNGEFVLKYHKAYHGTSVANVQSILDSRRLLLPGAPTPGHGCVTRPEGHFNDIWKPAGFDPNQIFMSPSIKYCTHHEVFSKRQRYTDSTTGVACHVKVCFKLLVEPESYTISRQTIVQDQSVIDELFSNDQLEWSTRNHESVYLYGVMVCMNTME